MPRRVTDHLSDEMLDRLDAAAREQPRPSESPWMAVMRLIGEVRELRSEVAELTARLGYAEERDETRDRRWQQALENAMRQLGDQEVALARGDIVRRRAEDLEEALRRHQRARRETIRGADRIDEDLWGALGLSDSP